MTPSFPIANKTEDGALAEDEADNDEACACAGPFSSEATRQLPAFNCSVRSSALLLSSSISLLLLLMLLLLPSGLVPPLRARASSSKTGEEIRVSILAGGKKNPTTTSKVTVATW